MQDIEFGNRLYQFRRKAGLSQAQLGGKVGVSNKAVSKWENGQAKPGLDIVHRLADILSVSVDELLNMSADEKQLTKIFCIVCIRNRIATYFRWSSPVA